ncbi:PAS domain S-box protein, partial [candidate division WWE3 bacterium]|nr:PAS domain S-box protein [candidate division WWE3 bacterium]
AIYFGFTVLSIVLFVYYLFPIIFPAAQVLWPISFTEVLLNSIGYIMVFTVVLLPLRNVYLNFVGKIIYGDKGDVQEMVHEFTDTVGRSVDLNTIRSVTISTFVELFNLDSITLHLEEVPAELQGYLKGESRLISYDELVNKGAKYGSTANSTVERQAHLARYMRNNNIEILIPLQQKTSLVGVIIVGSKKDETVFTESELSLMESLGKQMGISLENAHLFEALKKERNHVESEKNKLDLVLKSTVDGVIALDKDCRISFINDAACMFIGWEKEKVFHRNLEQVLHLSNEKHKDGGLSKSLCTFDEKEVSYYNVQLKAQNGEVRSVNVISNVVTEKVPGISRIVTLHDVTRENELEQIRIDFVSLAAHELKTPLTILRGYLYYLVDGVDAAAITPKAAESLNRAIVSTKTLTNLVDNLLNVSRIEQGKMQVSLQPANVIEIIEKTMIELEPLADDAGLKLELLPPEKELPTVRADATRIGEVMRNLISNGVKYTQEGGVTISCWQDGDEVVVSVRDTGQGIAEKSKPRLFTKFFREEQEMSKGSKGTGLGLYITKSIINAHGGRIWLESEVGKGSTFYFTLLVDKDTK